MQLLEMAEEDVPIENIVNDALRVQLYERHVDDALRSGAGTIDAEHILATIPAALKLNVASISRQAREAAKSKARSSLVQALAYYRTRDYDAAVKYLNNLMACSRLSGGLGDAANWDAKDEVLDAFGLYCERVEDADIVAEMGAVLGLEEADQARVRASVAAGESSSDREQKVQAGSGSGSIF
jgi:hypothetical protein